MYNDFLIQKGWIEESYIQLHKDQVKIAAGSEQMVEVMTEEQVDALLHFLERAKVSVRNKTMCYLLLYGGFRVSELVGIKRKDIDFMTSSLLVMGKGGKVREISLRNDVIDLMKCYIKGERAQSQFAESDYLFLSQRSPKVHPDGIRNWLSIFQRNSASNSTRIYLDIPFVLGY